MLHKRFPFSNFSTRTKIAIRQVNLYRRSSEHMKCFLDSDGVKTFILGSTRTDLGCEQTSIMNFQIWMRKLLRGSSSKVVVGSSSTVSGLFTNKL